MVNLELARLCWREQLLVSLGATLFTALDLILMKCLLELERSVSESFSLKLASHNLVSFSLTKLTVCFQPSADKVNTVRHVRRLTKFFLKWMGSKRMKISLS